MITNHEPAGQSLERCHDPEAAAISFPTTPMPLYQIGAPLLPTERIVLEKLARLLHELEPGIPAEAVQPERTMWEIGYESLGITALRVGLERVFGPECEPIRWLRLHRQRPRIGCLVRFLAAGPAAARLNHDDPG